MSTSSHKAITFQQEVTNLESTIAAIEAHRALLGDLAADTALDLLRERLATLVQPETARDERKRVTVLFADVKGYTALSETLDPEDVANIMNRLFEAVTVEIHRYGGTIDKYAGDAVMALFGAPQALENHEEMAARASLAMQRVIREFSDELNEAQGFQLQMRIGLNTGEVLAGLVGGLRARSYTVMGDTVNLAARLESAAPVGGILASEYTTRKLHNIFDLSEPAKIMVKGKSDEITVFQILGEKKQRGRVRGLDGLQAPMIGREQELAALKQRFETALTEHRWEAAAVFGEAGLGKTRLQRELVAWVVKTHGPTRILASRSFNHTRTTPYHFIAELIRNLFHFSRESNTETAVHHLTTALEILDPNASQLEINYQLGSLASILGFAMPNDPLKNLEPEQRRDRTFLSLERIFISAAKMTPLLILVDDLHWADALSLDFLKRLLTLMSQRQTENGQAFLLVLSRPAENPNSSLSDVLSQLSEPPHLTFHLKSLDTTQAESLISELLDQKIPADLCNLIVDHAQGNPFYVEEVLRSLIEDGTLKKNGSWKITQNLADIQIPPSVQDVLAARIDRLPPDDKQITQHAAIIGRIFWQDILNRITEVKSVEPTLLLLELRELADRMEDSKLAEDWEWVFNHGLIQEVAYSSVPRSMRKVLHRQVALLLEEQLGDQTGFLIPLIANHFEQGDTLDKAIEYLGLAGEQAAAQFANQEAISYFSRALALLDKQETTVFLTSAQLRQKYDLILGRVKIYHLVGQRAHQKDDLEKLAFLAQRIKDEKAQATVALQFASYYEAMSDFATAVQKAKEAVELADKANDPKQKVDGITAWALGHIRQGEIDKARDLTIQARDLARENNNELGEAQSLGYLGLVYFFEGNLKEARETLEHSLDLSRKLKDIQRQTSCLTNLVGIYHGLGDYAKAKIYSEEAVETTQMIGDRAKEITALNNLGCMYHALGDLDKAKMYQEESLKQSRLFNNKMGESLAAINLGLVLFDLGNASEALEYAAHSLKIDREIGDKQGEGYSLTALALALEKVGDLNAAAESHKKAFDLRQGTGQEVVAFDNLAGLASIALLQGDLETAQRYVEQVLDWLESNGVDGLEYPIRVYITCINFFHALGQSEKAHLLLNDAMSYLEEKASKISDPVVKQAFLENVPLHQQLRNMQTALASV